MAEAEAKTEPKAEPKKTYDCYDEEFNNNMEVMKTLLGQIQSSKEREIVKKWIRKLMTLKSTDPVVKKNRNHFFKYLLNVVNKGTWMQKVGPNSGGLPQYDASFGDDAEASPGPGEFMSKWSSDKKTYIAAKPLPGQGALVYMAVAEEPNMGWDHPSSP